MKTKIHTLEELQHEIERLKEIKSLKEAKLRSDVKHLTVQLKPVNLIKSAFSSLTGDTELKTQVASKGLEATLGFLFTNLIFKNSNPMIRTAAAVLGTAAASKIFGEDSPKYIEKIKLLIDKIKRKRSEAKDASFNEGDIYTNEK